MKTNKTMRYLLLIATAMVVLASCGGGDDDDTPTPPPVTPSNPDNPNKPSQTETTLEVSPTSLYIDYEGGQKTVTVTTNAPSWTATCDQSWCTTKREGTTLIVTAEANNEKELRTAIITIKTSDEKEQRKLTVTQTANAGGSYIHPIQTTITFSAKATKIEEVIRVETNLTGWTCRSDADWCMARCDATNLYLFIVEHLLMEERKAVVTLSHEGVDYAQVFVTQEGTILLETAFPEGQTLPVAGGSINVKVYTNIKDWTAATASNCWFSIDKTDSETLTLTALKREGSSPRPPQEVTITAEYKTTRFTISEASSENENYGYGEGAEWDD